MEQSGILPEIFYEILIQTDSFIQMRDLIMQLKQSYNIPEYILQKLSQKFNIEYHGNGKQQFIEKIRGMTNLVNKMSELSNSNKYNITIATIKDLPRWYFEYQNPKDKNISPYETFNYQDYESPYDYEYTIALIIRAITLNSKQFVTYFIKNHMDDILEDENENVELNEVLTLLIKNGYSCNLSYYAEMKYGNIAQLKDIKTRNLFSKAQEICPFEKGMNF